MRGRIRSTVAVAALVLTGTGWSAAAATAGPVINRASLYNSGRPCSTSRTDPLPVGSVGPLLQAIGTDADAGAAAFRYTFVISSLDGSVPETRIAVTPSANDRLASVETTDAVHDGGTYSWRVRLTDSHGTSAWSQTCVFRLDLTAPRAPTITSDNYPHDAFGPVGQQARFTFSGGGDPDTAGFLFAWGDILPVEGCSYGAGPQGQEKCPDPLAAADVVRAPKPGGKIQVSLSPPMPSQNDLTVAAIDRAGNLSTTARVTIEVPPTGPTVTTADPGLLCGSDPTVTLTPATGVTHVTSYRYTVDGGATYKTVKAGRSGSATAHVAPPQESLVLEVRSTSTDGFVSTAQNAFLSTGPSPGVSSATYPSTGVAAGGVGVQGTFTFAPPADESVSGYRYRVGPGAETEVAATTDGSATVSYAPRSPGGQTMTVVAEPDDGSVSCPAAYTFVVAGSGTSSPPSTQPPGSSATPTSAAPSMPAPASGSVALHAYAGGGSVLADGVTLRPGASVRFDLTGFAASADVAVTLHSRSRVVGSVRTDAQGSATYRLTLPSDLEPGDHRVAFTSGGRAADFRFVVSGAAQYTTTGSAPAETGVDVRGLLGASIALLGLGLVLVTPARRRAHARH